jgi:methylation protein EvaC
MNKIKFLDLGKQPIANGFLYPEEIHQEYFYHLEVGFDPDSKLITHMEYVDPPLMFNENYAYRGSMSNTMVAHFKELSYYLKEILPQYPYYKRDGIKVLEIGSNDGVFIKNWPKETTFAVEPCKNFAEETNNMGYKTYPEFWDVSLSSKIKEEVGEMDLIFAANCICHIPDLDETFRAVKNLLSKNGVFIFEDPSLAEMINSNSYDQIYDEHPHIFSVTALKNILNRNGMEIVRVDNIPVHGGSNRIWAKRTEETRDIRQDILDRVNLNLEFERVLGLDSIKTFTKFAERVNQSKEDLIRILSRCKSEGKKVISYGATSKSTTVFNFCGITPDLVEYIVDTTPEKQGKLSPGCHLPIISPQDGFNSSVDIAFLGAWNFSEEIKKKESSFIEKGGKFLTHVPIVKFV